MARLRLHKFLAMAGVASRRQCEVLIAAGAVSVDGEIVREMGIVIDPEAQEVRYDGDRVRAERAAYYLVNKPKGYLCTSEDRWGRPTVVSLVTDRLHRRLYTVGRLDEDAEGLIIVTNDGEFANKLSHSRFGIDKTYEIRVTGQASDESLEQARDGIWLAEGKTAPMAVRILARSPKHSRLRVTIRDGKNRELRRIFARLGHNVQRLIRIGIGPLRISGLKQGGCRKLKAEETSALLERVAQKEGAAPPARRRPVSAAGPKANVQRQEKTKRPRTPTVGKTSRKTGRSRR